MKKTIFLSVIALAIIAFTNTSNARPAKAASGNTFSALNGNKLIVVLLESDDDYVAKLKKKHEDKELEAYSNSIKTYNDNIQEIAPKYFNMGRTIEFKTPSEIATMTVDDRNTCFFLLYNRAISFEGMRGQATDHGCDFYNKSQKDVARSVKDYKECTTFEWLDPKYKGEDDNRMLTLYMPRGNYEGSAVTQNLASFVPTKAELVLCLTQLTNTMTANTAWTGKTDRKARKEEMEKKNKENVAIIQKKTLLICKDNFERAATNEGVKANYPYPFKLVSKADFDNAILTKDSSVCLLWVMPFMKMPNMGSGQVKYAHTIIDPATCNTMLQVFSGKMVINGFGMAGYQTISVAQMHDIADEMDKDSKK